MTLVMAFIGERGAVMGGDLREITFLGDRPSIELLEQELYDGRIATDGDLRARAGELGVRLGIRDDKVKVSERGGVLIGEVTSLEGGVPAGEGSSPVGGVLRRRRLFASGGSYAILDTEGPSSTLKGSGGAGNFVVLGNEKTKAIAHRCIREGWRKGTLEDAKRLIARALELAHQETASVSRGHLLIGTGERVDVRKVVERETGRPS